MRRPLTINADDADLFEQAARIEGMSIQQFVLHAALERAGKVLKTGTAANVELENLLAECHNHLSHYSGTEYHVVEALRARIREALNR